MRAKFEEMKSKDLKPDIITFNSMISGYGKKGDMGGMSELFNLMLAMGIQPDEVTFSCLMDGCNRAAQCEKSNQIFENLFANRQDLVTSTTFSIWIDGCGFSKQTSLLDGVWKKLTIWRKKPDSNVFNSLVEAWLRNHNLPKAVDVLKNMQSRGLPCSYKTATTFLSQYLAMVEKALEGNMSSSTTLSFSSLPPPPAIQLLQNLCFKFRKFKDMDEKLDLSPADKREFMRAIQDIPWLKHFAIKVSRTLR
eukprot:TRINITY_DN9011_c0_g1_i1.p1 TRINITY_DN9011_c0_g1~~TRINITY_DN9011_c0_g1_i1.p1  ORF type:complete len:272 (+),score=47.61 TRINITY_DN9011_c0_g1_i1:67-816(+)